MKKDDAKKLEKAIEKLRANLVLVEGKRDKKALELLGCKNVLTIAGRKNQLANLISEKKVIVATDLDKSGNELAEAIKNEIEGFAQVDCETRRELGKLLRLKYFEDIKRKYEKFYEEKGEKNG